MRLVMLWRRGRSAVLGVCDPGLGDRALLGAQRGLREATYRGTSLHQRPDMALHGAGEAGLIVAAFEHGDEAAFGVFGGDVHEHSRERREVLVSQGELP